MSALHTFLAAICDTDQHRGCFTCRHSPRFPEPGCDLLTFDEQQDAPIVDYCEASGVNDEDNPLPGFPLNLAAECPKWEGR